jgi:hypothetical protein
MADICKRENCLTNRAYSRLHCVTTLREIQVCSNGPVGNVLAACESCRDAAAERWGNEFIDRELAKKGCVEPLAFTTAILRQNSLQRVSNPRDHRFHANDEIRHKFWPIAKE